MLERFLADLSREIGQTDRYEFRETLHSGRAVPQEASPTECNTDDGDRARAPYGGAVMADVAYVAVTAVFFWLTWWLVKLCERL